MPIHVLDRFYLGLTAVMTVGYQLFFFTIAFCKNFDDVTDFAGSTNIIILAIVTLILGSRDPPFDAVTAAPPPRQLCITILLCIWAFRLGTYLVIRIIQTGSDKRFDNIRGKFLPFFAFWLGQMAWVWTTALPVTVLNSPAVQSAAMAGRLPKFGTARDIAGIVLFGLGLVCETVADLQLYNFKRRERLDATLVFHKTGIYHYSRHPNFFGEILVQAGIFTIASADTQYYGHYTTRPAFVNAINASVVGLASVLFSLLFMTGVPLHEHSTATKCHKAGDTAWQEYIEYRDRTSVLLPLPPAVFVRIPKFIKVTLLFEFPLYRHEPPGPPGGGIASSANTQPAPKIPPLELRSKPPPPRLNPDVDSDPDAPVNDRSAPPLSASTISSAAK